MLTAVVFASSTYSHRAYAALDEILPATSSEVSTEQIAGRGLRVRTRGDLKEFAGDDGKVFAAGWSGSPPNLRALLGSHFAAYETAVRSRRPGGHNHLFLETPELTINVFAHGRLFVGKVCLTQKLPKGMTVDALQ